MPVTLNVGLSRKVGDSNYGSRGANVNIELEADSGLIAEPAKLQERIRQMFALVRQSLNEELNGGSQHNGSGNGQAKASQPRPVTQSQIKAIYAIAKSKGIDLTPLLRSHFKVSKPNDLSIKEASTFIDQLKNGAGE